MDKIERRSELTGKKIILLASNAPSIDTTQAEESISCEKWINKSWKSAVIRCSSGNDVTSKDLMVRRGLPC